MKPVKIYTTTHCGYCRLAKRLLDEKGIRYEEIDVSGDDAMRARLEQLSGGRRTVPQIWVGERHVGGFRELARLDESGELDRLLGIAAADL